LKHLNLKNRRKIGFWLILLLGIGLSSSLMKEAQAIAVLSIVGPDGTQNITGERDTFFNVNVTITNVQNLYGFEFNLTWNPNILNITTVKMGDFFLNYFVWKNQSWWFDRNRDETKLAGQMWFSATLPLGTQLGKSGNGTLLKVSFVVKSDAAGITPIHIGDPLNAALTAKLSAVDPITKALSSVEHTTVDGRFTTLVPNPVADFTFSPSSPEVGQDVTFNGSLSYSPRTGGSITNYVWDLGDGNTQHGSDKQIITHAYGSTGTYSVNLTVTDDASFTGSIVKQVTVSAPAVPKHDVSILSITPNPTTAKPGDSVSLIVIARNVGTFNENFTVSVFYDTTRIGDPQQVTNLSPANTQTLTFSWNTAGLAAGTYTIKAEASSVPEEAAADQANNVRTIQFTLQGEQTNIWLYVGIGVGVAIVAAIAAYLIIKRRKPEAAASESSE